MNKIRFALAFHNHQPVGNFDGVIEQAYQDSYLPFLQVLQRYPDIRFSLHTSGCLLEWLAERRPEYIDQLRGMVRSGQVEIIGGGFYEPIMPMIPSRDRVGQIRGFSEYLQEMFGVAIRGMWTPERVWEQSLVKDLALAGIEYTILDDYHFQKAGLVPDQLHGYYLSEDEGRLLRIVPGSETMRYLIPFQDVDRLIEELGRIHRQHPNALVVFADDGEKFGVWPDTKQHVYVHGWIYRFLDALRANAHWIDVCTLSEALDSLPPAGSIYLPDCSYREMTEWSLPADQLTQYDRLYHDLDHQNNGAALKRFMKGGFWRNFKVKYPESNEMYARMMQVSDAIDRVCHQTPAAVADERVHAALHELYRGQCNCSYWHGAFGGLYLPHLRNAVYEHLIAAENLLLEYERVGQSHDGFVKSNTADYDFDGQPEIRVENDQYVAFLDPGMGGRLYELDLRTIGVNLGNTLARRPEAYHEKIRNAHLHQHGQVASIHDRVVFKQEGLERRLQYDAYPRKSLIDHFYDGEPQAEQWQFGEVTEVGDFVTGKYEARISNAARQSTVVLSRRGKVGSDTIQITKTIVVEPLSDRLLVTYRLSELPSRPLSFAVELNFASLASGADDRYYYTFDQHGTTRHGQLQSILNLSATPHLALVDEWLGIDVGVRLSKPAAIWTFPIQSVSQSEAGFELVHQSSCVMPHWTLTGDSRVWEIELQLHLNTSLAQSRKQSKPEKANVR